MLADIEKRRLELMGHLVRMDHGRVVTKIFQRKLEGRKSRIKGRPRL
jgi:hypothetical protein